MRLVGIIHSSNAIGSALGNLQIPCEWTFPPSLLSAREIFGHCSGSFQSREKALARPRRSRSVSSQRFVFPLAVGGLNPPVATRVCHSPNSALVFLVS